jgi:hypothetical protein
MANATATYMMLKSGPEVPCEEVELANVQSLEIMILWGTSVLHVEHLTPPRSYCVGEEQSSKHRCDFFLPAEVLGTSRLPVAVTDGARVSVVLPPGATGTIELSGTAPQSLEQARPRAEPCTELSGSHLLELPGGAKARIVVGQFVFQLAAVNAGKPLPAGFAAGRDYVAASYFGMTLLAHAGLIAALAFFVPPLGLTDDEDEARQRLPLIQAYLGAQAEREQQLRPATEAAEQERRSHEGGTGTRAAGEEGQMGKSTAVERDGHYGVKGPRDNPQSYLARSEALREAREFGMIGLLNIVGGDPDAPVAPWGRESALGTDEVSKQGHMWGSSLGEAWGLCGLGLSGIGEGGGGRGEGIGLGEIGGLGRGAGTGTGQGFGPGGGAFSHGRLAPAHQSKVPRVRPGQSTVNGRLPPEVIQRIVRQNYGRFRMCYEQGLKGNPNLEGRVSVRFVIGSDGAVSHVSNGGSDLPSSSVVACVVRAYYGLSFPQPEGGIVTVVYPIMFAPG